MQKVMPYMYMYTVHLSSTIPEFNTSTLVEPYMLELYRKKHGWCVCMCACVLTSGARYSGVPQKVRVVAPYVISSLQRPKSVSLMWPSSSSRRFSSYTQHNTQHSSMMMAGAREKSSLVWIYSNMGPASKGSLAYMYSGISVKGNPE